MDPQHWNTTKISGPHLAHVCRCVDVHDAGQVEEHDVTVRIEDGLYFRLAATSSSPVLQQEVRASGELVDVNTLKGENLKIKEHWIQDFVWFKNFILPQSTCSKIQATLAFELCKKQPCAFCESAQSSEALNLINRGTDKEEIRPDVTI